MYSGVRQFHYHTTRSKVDTVMDCLFVRQFQTSCNTSHTINYFNQFPFKFFHHLWIFLEGTQTYLLLSIQTKTTISVCSISIKSQLRFSTLSFKISVTLLCLFNVSCNKSGSTSNKTHRQNIQTILYQFSHLRKTHVHIDFSY